MITLRWASGVSCHHQTNPAELIRCNCLAVLPWARSGVGTVFFTYLVSLRCCSLMRGLLLVLPFVLSSVDPASNHVSSFLRIERASARRC